MKLLAIKAHSKLIMLFIIGKVFQRYFFKACNRIDIKHLKLKEKEKERPILILQMQKSS